MRTINQSLRFAFVSLVCGLTACGGGSSSGQAIEAPAPAPGQPAAASPVAIDDLVAGQWLELRDTKIRSVLPSPLPDGEPSNLIRAWSGGTVDTVRSRLLVWGGGHADYAGNEMYALDLATLTIRRIVDPSPYTGQSNCSPALPDGTPASRHTYDALAYIAHADKLFTTGGSLASCGAGDLSTWTYDFTALKWTRNIALSPMTTPYGTMAVYDATSKLVYVKDQGALYTYASETNSYSRLADNLAVDYHLSAAIDTKRRKFVMIGDGVQVIDLATNKLTTMSTRNAPALALPGPIGRPTGHLARRKAQAF